MKRRSKCSILALALVVCGVAACDAPTSARPPFAFDPVSLTGGVLYRWPSGSTIRVWTEPDPGASVSLVDAVTRASGNWNDVPSFGEFRLERASGISDANIVVYDRAVSNPIQPAACTFDPRGSGYTYFCLPQGNSGSALQLQTTSGAPTNVTVVISVDRGRISSQSGYEAVVAHELGHALGIGGHSPVVTDVMFGSPTVARPSARDRETLRYVLGQAASALLR